MAPIRPVGGGPAGDLQLFRDVGGERVLASLATVAGNTAAVFVMDGPGSAGTALDAALDFQRVYARACIAHPAPSTHDIYLRPTAPPVNSEEAETRLRSILRLAAESGRAGAAPAATADIAAAAAPTRRHSSDRPVRSIPLTASTERVWRAVDASIVDKLGAPAEIVKAKAFSALADPVKECRRLIDLHGPPAAATILSSGEADGEVTHDPDPSLPAARTSLASHCKRHHETVVTSSRLRESAADVIALRDGVVSVDVDWELVVKLYGSVQPKPAAWRTSHDAASTRGALGLSIRPTCVRGQRARRPLVRPALRRDFVRCGRRRRSRRPYWRPPALRAEHAAHDRRLPHPPRQGGVREDRPEPPAAPPRRACQPGRPGGAIHPGGSRGPAHRGQRRCSQECPDVRQSIDLQCLSRAHAYVISVCKWCVQSSQSHY